MSFTPVFNPNNGMISYNKNNTLNKWIDPNAQGITSGPRGNIGIVDTIYGDDSSGSFGGTPFLTISVALSVASSGKTIYVLPGTYTLTSGITIPNNVSIVGFSQERVIIQMNVTTSTTMITIENNVSIENVSLVLNASGSIPNITLIGILFINNSAQTSKIINCNLLINNSTMTSTLTNTISGIVFNGINQTVKPILEYFAYICIINSIIKIYSNGSGNKRGILINNTNLVSIFNTSVFVAKPTNTSSTGSYVAIETNDSNNLGSIQIRSSAIGCVVPITGELYTASDILQSTPEIITNPSY